MFRSEALPILTIIANICAGSFTDLSRLESQSGAKKNMQTTRSWARKNSSKWQWALTKVQHGESRQVGNLDSKFWVYGLGFQAVRISQEKRKTRFDHFWPLKNLRKSFVIYNPLFVTYSHELHVWNFEQHVINKNDTPCTSMYHIRQEESRLQHSIDFLRGSTRWSREIPQSVPSHFESEEQQHHHTHPGKGG